MTADRQTDKTDTKYTGWAKNLAKSKPVYYCNNFVCWTAAKQPSYILTLRTTGKYRLDNLMGLELA